MDIVKTLQEIEAQTVENQKKLASYVAEYSKQQHETVQKLHAALYHLDRVLQIESRRRVTYTNYIESEILAKEEELLARFYQLYQAESGKMHQLFQQLREQNDANRASARLQQQTLNEALEHWKSSSSRSTAAIKARLDETRAERIVLLTNLRTGSEKDFRKVYRDMSAFQIQIDQLLINFKTYAESVEKKFEGGNKEDLSEFEHAAAYLCARMRGEEYEMQLMHGDISRSLGVAVETTQNSMALLATVLKKKA